jgi:hypothetical protein
MPVNRCHLWLPAGVLPVCAVLLLRECALLRGVQVFAELRLNPAAPMTSAVPGGPVVGAPPVARTGTPPAHALAVAPTGGAGAGVRKALMIFRVSTIVAQVPVHFCRTRWQGFAASRSTGMVPHTGTLARVPTEWPNTERGSYHDIFLMDATTRTIVARPGDIWRFYTPDVADVRRKAVERRQDPDAAVRTIPPASVWIRKVGAGSCLSSLRSAVSATCECNPGPAVVTADSGGLPRSIPAWEVAQKRCQGSQLRLRRVRQSPCQGRSVVRRLQGWIG